MLKDLSEVFYEELGRKLKEVRIRAGLKQRAVGLVMGFKPASGQAFLSRLERGDVRGVELDTLVSYLRACRAPVNKFILELAQSGVFGEAEADDVRGFTSQKLRGETSNEEKRARRSCCMRSAGSGNCMTRKR